jgi:hypothetical protein
MPVTVISGFLGESRATQYRCQGPVPYVTVWRALVASRSAHSPFPLAPSSSCLGTGLQPAQAQQPCIYAVSKCLPHASAHTPSPPPLSPFLGLPAKSAAQSHTSTYKPCADHAHACSCLHRYALCVCCLTDTLTTTDLCNCHRGWQDHTAKPHPQ